MPPYSISKREEEPQNYKLSDRTAGKCWENKWSQTQPQPQNKVPCGMKFRKQSLTEVISQQGW